MGIEWTVDDARDASTLRAAVDAFEPRTVCVLVFVVPRRRRGSGEAKRRGAPRGSSRFFVTFCQCPCHPPWQRHWQAVTMTTDSAPSLGDLDRRCTEKSPVVLDSGASLAAVLTRSPCISHPTRRRYPKCAAVCLEPWSDTNRCGPYISRSCPEPSQASHSWRSRA